MGSAVEIAPGLHRWTAWHEEWREDVGSVAVATADGLVLIDPLAPPPELAEPAHVLVTVYWHGRGAAAAQGPRVWAPARSAVRSASARSRSPTRSARATPCPEASGRSQTPRAAEVLYRLPDHRALVVGDVLLGAGAKPHATTERLRLCPERRLGVATHDDLRESLTPLLELPIESVLVSHGEPVASGGKRALAAALAA